MITTNDRDQKFLRAVFIIALKYTNNTCCKCMFIQLSITHNTLRVNL